MRSVGITSSQVNVYNNHFCTVLYYLQMSAHSWLKAWCKLQVARFLIVTRPVQHDILFVAYRHILRTHGTATLLKRSRPRSNQYLD